MGREILNVQVRRSPCQGDMLLTRFLVQVGQVCSS